MNRYEIQANMAPVDQIQREFLKEWRTIAYCDNPQQAQRLTGHNGLRVIDTVGGKLLETNVIPLPSARFG